MYCNSSITLNPIDGPIRGVKAALWVGLSCQSRLVLLSLCFVTPDDTITSQVESSCIIENGSVQAVTIS